MRSKEHNQQRSQQQHELCFHVDGLVDGKQHRWAYSTTIAFSALCREICQPDATEGGPSDPKLRQK